MLHLGGTLAPTSCTRLRPAPRLCLRGSQAQLRPPLFPSSLHRRAHKYGSFLRCWPRVRRPLLPRTEAQVADSTKEALYCSAWLLTLAFEVLIVEHLE